MKAGIAFAALGAALLSTGAVLALRNEDLGHHGLFPGILFVEGGITLASGTAMIVVESIRSASDPSRPAGVSVGATMRF